MNESIEDIVEYKFDLIKIALNNKSMNIKDWESLREKIILINKLNKKYYNNEKIDYNELNVIKQYLNSKKMR